MRILVKDKFYERKMRELNQLRSDVRWMRQYIDEANEEIERLKVEVENYKDLVQQAEDTISYYWMEKVNELEREVELLKNIKN